MAKKERLVCVLCGGPADVAGGLDLAGLIYKDKVVCGRCCFDIWDSINQDVFFRSRLPKKVVNKFGHFWFSEDSIRIKNKGLKWFVSKSKKKK